MRGRRDRRDRGGVALLVVVAAITVLTVLVTDISFGARVRVLTAVHEREEMEAQYLARSGISLYRLVLQANYQLSSNKTLAPYLEMMGIPAGDALWRMVPFINTGLLRMLLVSDGDVEEEEVEDFASSGRVSDEVMEESREDGGSRFSGRNFLDFNGDFSVSVRGEDCRINVNQFAARATGTMVQDTPVGQQIYGLLSGEENDQFLRDRNLDKWDLIANLADWADADGDGSTTRGGYEDDLYNRQEPPYLAKNAKFDTLDEIRLVEGWQDDVYDRFAAGLTIYGAGKVNINCAEDLVLKGLLYAYVTPNSPDFLDQLVAQVREYMLLVSFKDGNDFVKWLEAQAGVGSVNPALAAQISTATSYFTLSSIGQSGDSTATITSVVEYKNEQGKVLYWRMD